MHKAITAIALLLSQFVFSQEEKKPEELQEVTIEKENRTFTNKNGNIKVDVANSIYNAVPNTLDLLAKLPKIIISPDKQSINLVGKGSPLLYIDNQKVGIDDLNSLAVEDIKTIEIINNPSSKYEAEGRAVILITLKFSKKEGYKITVSENAIFKKYFNNYSGINSNFKNGKLEFKANFNYNQLKVWESNGNDFTIPDYGIQSNYLVTAITKRPQFVFGGGVFYKINADDYFSISVNSRSQKDIFDVITNTFNQDQNAIDYINTRNANAESRSFANSFMNYNHKIKSLEVVLFTGLQYSNFSQKMNSVISNNYNNTGFALSQLQQQDFGVAVFSGRIDLEKSWKNGMKLELGGLYLQADAQTDFVTQNSSPPTTTESIYQYKEKNIAAYSQFSGTFKKVNYTLGVRAENTIVKGKFAQAANLSVDKDYLNIFPKAQLEFVIDSNNTISLGFAKSIERPDFSSTSQATIYINPYFVWSDNINLDPTFTDEYSIGYQYKKKSLKIIHYQTTNPTFYTGSYDDSQNLLTFTSINLEKETDFAIEFTLPFAYKWWANTNVINLGHTKIADSRAVVNQSAPSLYVYSNHVVSLPKKTEISFTAWGYTDQQLGVFKRSGLITMDAAISKTFFKQLDCTLSINDIFRKMNFTDDFTINNVSAKGRYYTDSHAVSISLRYSFGKIKKSEFKEKDVDENSGRIK